MSRGRHRRNWSRLLRRRSHPSLKSICIVNVSGHNTILLRRECLCLVLFRIASSASDRAQQKVLWSQSAGLTSDAPAHFIAQQLDPFSDAATVLGQSANFPPGTDLGFSRLHNSATEKG